MKARPELQHKPRASTIRCFLAGAVAATLASILASCQTSRDRSPASGKVDESGKFDESLWQMGDPSRAFLSTDERTEEAGYGLYTYILFAEKPLVVEGTQLAIIRAFLTDLEETERLEKHGFKRNQLNIVKMLITQKPPPEVSADWVFQHYDYARAKFWVRKGLTGVIKDETSKGIYMLSLTNEMTLLEQDPTGRPSPTLIQDFHSVPPPVAEFWMKAFLQGAGHGCQDVHCVASLTLRIRTQLSAWAEPLPRVVEAVTTFVGLFRGKEEKETKETGSEDKTKTH